MRIGILTLPLHTNYGGILQAYALQTVLERMGHEVEVITFPRVQVKLNTSNSTLTYTKRFIKRFILQKNIYVFQEKKINQLYQLSTKNTQRFIDKYINTRLFSNPSAIEENDYDAIVVGSDQIWRAPYVNKYAFGIKNAYLEFTKGWRLNRISYAASFGTEDWEYTFDETEACRELIKNFNAISVREYEGVSLCEKHFGVNAVQVLDPTMLLEKCDYEKIVEQSDAPQSIGDLFVYVFERTNKIQNVIENLSIEKRLIPFSLDTKQIGPYTNANDLICKPVESWLRGFVDSKLILTDSFHACVFSLIFNKPFIVFGNKGRGMSRFKSLLKLFNCEYRMIESYDEINDSHFKEPSIDKSLVYDTSMIYLNNAFRFNINK